MPSSKQIIMCRLTLPSMVNHTSTLIPFKVNLNPLKGAVLVSSSRQISEMISSIGVHISIYVNTRKTEGTCRWSWDPYYINILLKSTSSSTSVKAFYLNLVLSTLAQYLLIDVPDKIIPRFVLFLFANVSLTNSLRMFFSFLCERTHRSFMADQKLPKPFQSLHGEEVRKRLSEKILCFKAKQTHNTNVRHFSVVKGMIHSFVKGRT